MRVLEIDYGEPHTLVVVDRPFWRWVVEKIAGRLINGGWWRYRACNAAIVWASKRDVDVLHVSVAHGCTVAEALWPKWAAGCWHDDDGGAA